MGSERKKSKKFSEPTKNTDNFRVFVPSNNDNKRRFLPITEVTGFLA